MLPEETLKFSALRMQFPCILRGLETFEWCLEITSTTLDRPLQWISNGWKAHCFIACAHITPLLKFKAQCNLCKRNFSPRTVLCRSFEVPLFKIFIYCKSCGQQHIDHVMILTFSTLYLAKNSLHSTSSCRLVMTLTNWIKNNQGGFKAAFQIIYTRMFWLR